MPTTTTTTTRLTRTERQLALALGQIDATTAPDAVALREARQRWAAHRQTAGLARLSPAILTPPDANQKLDKSALPTYGLSLAPARESGTNVCPASTPACRAACVAFSGKGRFESVGTARKARTTFLLSDPTSFGTIVAAELHKALRKHPEGIAFRPNTFSDIAWEGVWPSLLAIPGVTMYDYTKRWERSSSEAYHLTFSATERTTEADIAAAVASGRNVAVVMSTTRTKDLPATYADAPVVNGDKTDFRPADPTAVVVGLRAKGSLIGAPAGDRLFVKAV